MVRTISIWRLTNKYLLALMMLIYLPCNIEAKGRSNGVQEIWQEHYLSHRLGKKVNAGLLFNNLYRTNIGAYDWFIEAGLKYNISSWLDLEGNYRQEYFLSNGAWTYENRPFLRVSVNKSFGKLNVRNRQRFEMRFFEYGSSSFRYRSDVRVKLEWNLTKLDLNPYLQEEIFISSGELTRLRSYFGVLGKIGRFEPSAYLLVQSDSELPQWEHALICGFCIGIYLSDIPGQ